MPSQILWPVETNPPPLNDNEVHVWAASLDLSPLALNRLAKLLSDEERERAARFKFKEHQNRFLAARSFMREMLGRYLHVAAAQLEFTYSSRGKPSLPSRLGKTLQFNLAHSEDLALLAITCVAAIGVDVEFIRAMKDMDSLVTRFFSSRENRLFQKLRPEQKPQAFFNLWTRKEAFLKATGEGITGSLSGVEVSFLPGEDARLLAINSNEEATARWTLRDFSPAANFVGAIAVEAVSNLSLKCLAYKPGETVVAQ